MSESNSTSGWVVYILQCADQTLYTGVTTDPERRLQEHNSDNRLGARYTRSRRPVTMIYQESCTDRSSACQREAAIKKLSRQAKLRLISASRPDQ
ncbi:MAG: GIY-YIG nuclease family protein [Amphritea sp.]|nr:GIY-YIG nuclease family protein [Amphritea sp.]